MNLSIQAEYPLIYASSYLPQTLYQMFSVVLCKYCHLHSMSMLQPACWNQDHHNFLSDQLLKIHHKNPLLLSRSGLLLPLTELSLMPVRKPLNQVRFRLLKSWMFRLHSLLQSLSRLFRLLHWLFQCRMTGCLLNSRRSEYRRFLLPHISCRNLHNLLLLLLQVHISVLLPHNDQMFFH